MLRDRRLITSQPMPRGKPAEDDIGGKGVGRNRLKELAKCRNSHQPVRHVDIPNAPAVKRLDNEARSRAHNPPGKRLAEQSIKGIAARLPGRGGYFLLEKSLPSM